MTETTKQLERQAKELRQVLEEPSAKQRAKVELEQIERELAARREADGKAEAEQRQVGLRRAHGSKRDQYEKALERLVEIVQAVPAAAAEVDAIYRDLRKYQAEDHGLADRFGLPRSEFPAVTVPLLTPQGQAVMSTLPSITLLDHGHLRPHTEKCEHGLRTRRTFKEIGNTPAYAIIERAGLRPFPELSARQVAELAARRDREEAERAFAEEIEAHLQSQRVEDRFRQAVRDEQAQRRSTGPGSP
jgi:hypothetical protein